MKFLKIIINDAQKDVAKHFLKKRRVIHSVKLRPEDVLRTSPKNVLTFSGRPDMILYVAPRDASAGTYSGRQFNHNP